jgi:hypothetical protein
MISMKTRSFDFSKAKTLRAIFKKIAHLILHRHASYTTYFKLWFTVDPEDVDSGRSGTRRRGNRRRGIRAESPRCVSLHRY